jgi:hypothetical protein
MKRPDVVESVSNHNKRQGGSNEVWREYTTRATPLHRKTLVLYRAFDMSIQFPAALFG